MTFKIGDWVSYDNGFKDVLFQIKEFECYGIIKYNSKRIKEQYLKLWKPKQAEWCWFYDDTEYITMNIVAKYSHTDKCGHYILGDKVEYPHTFCEPFLGELPSFIKDIHGTN